MERAPNASHFKAVFCIVIGEVVLMKTVYSFFFEAFWFKYILLFRLNYSVLCFDQNFGY